VKRPTRIQVGPYLVRVVWDADLLDSDAGGHFEGSKLRIIVNPDTEADVQRSVLLHELLHACVFCGAEESIKDEESAVSVLTTPLFQVLRDNPKVVAWLSE
jgi:hypothetical protein